MGAVVVVTAMTVAKDLMEYGVGGSWTMAKGLRGRKRDVSWSKRDRCEADKQNER